MRIIVDTKEDSPEDIRKAAAFLSSLSDSSKEKHSNIFESSGDSLGNSESDSSNQDEGMGSGIGSNAFASMFGAASSSSCEPDNPTPDAANILDQAGTVESEQEQKSDEEDSQSAPKIIEY